LGIRVVTTPQADHYIVVVSTSGWNRGFLFLFRSSFEENFPCHTKSKGICCEKFPFLEKKIIKKNFENLFLGGGLKIFANNCCNMRFGFGLFFFFKWRICNKILFV
jgi:hypothetical protein